MTGKNLLVIQVSLCYILKHLEDRETLSVHFYCTWCDIILIFKLYRIIRLTPRSSIHSLKFRMTSHRCNKYEQITLPYLLSVTYMCLLCICSVNLVRRCWFVHGRLRGWKLKSVISSADKETP